MAVDECLQAGPQSRCTVTLLCRLYTTLPATRQSHEKGKKKNKKKKQGSISRPLAFCLNSSRLHLSPLYREWKRVGGSGGAAGRAVRRNAVK